MTDHQTKGQMHHKGNANKAINDEQEVKSLENIKIGVVTDCQSRFVAPEWK